MWFNSTQREEPYQGLTLSRNERNPYHLLPARKGGNSNETAADNAEEGGDDVKSSCPLCPGLHTYYNGMDREQRTREGKRTP